MKTILESKRLIATSFWLLTLKRPDGYPEPQPGQFIGVVCNGEEKPFSVAFVREESLIIVVEAKGEGTRWLINQLPRTEIEISPKPLGNGFKLESGRRHLIVGGGIGVAPLLSVAQRISLLGSSSADAILCFTTKDKMILKYNFRMQSVDTSVATDDGSFGSSGRADVILRQRLEIDHQYDEILACGPKVMLKAVAEIAAEFGIPCQVCVEEYMLCMIGACKGCAIDLVSGKGTVCKDGPVFDGEEVIWHD